MTQARIVDRDNSCHIGARLVFGWPEKRKPLLASLQAFENGLADVFAGFLKTSARGRWYADHEACIAYDFTSERSRADVVEDVERLLCLHGGGLHVQWVHFELRDVQGCHVKLEAGADRGLSELADDYAGRWPRGDMTRDEMHERAAQDRAVRGTPTKFLRNRRTGVNTPW